MKKNMGALNLVNKISNCNNEKKYGYFYSCIENSQL